MPTTAHPTRPRQAASLPTPWLLLLATIAASASACVINDRGCQEECYSRRVVVCDSFFCWEEYQTECFCVDQGCRGDFQCRGDEYCGSDGFCYLLGAGPGGGTGTAGLCQACVDHNDCAEQGALCLKLGSTETVCGRPCQTDSNCPNGYTCNSLQGQSGSQCVPSTFSCQNTPSGCTQDSQCATNQRCDAGRCIDRPSGCTQNTDCPSGQRCDNGACVNLPPPPQCSATLPCPSGQTCQLGQCVPSTPQCSVDNPCPSGFDCADGQCVAQTPECSTSLACPVGYTCDAGRCTPNAGSSCATNADCSMGQLCIDAQCRAPECRVGADCGPDMACVNASCLPACSATLPCPGGYLCRQNLGFCDIDPNAQCQSSTQCGEGQTCHGGQCLTACRASCECSTGDLCNDNGACVPALPAQRACATECDCPSGEQCVDAICVSPNAP